MIGKILIEINRLKNELDGYSAKEGLDYIESYINTLSKQQVKEPSEDLAEAAEKFAHFYDNGTCDGIAQECFIAGAEWMAAQGATCNGEIQMDFSEPDDIYARRLSADYWNELGPALMKVEPGKVLIQIRKK